MKKISVLVVPVVVAFTLNTGLAQPPRMGQPPGPKFDAAMAKLFGNNSAFSANVEFHSTRPGGGEMVMPGKIAFLDGKVRFEMDMAGAQGGRMNPQSAARMKQMGMSTIVNITRPDKKLTYLVYPDMKSYVENPMRESDSGAAPSSDFKTEVTKLGDESVDGHECVKNKIVVTGKDGVAHESTVWNARDLKDFPVKMEMKSEQGGETTMLYKDIKVEKPDAAQFDVPSDFTKYDDVMSMIMSRARRPPPQ